MEKELLDHQIDQRRHRRLNRQAVADARRIKKAARTSAEKVIADAPGGIDGSAGDPVKQMARCLAWSVGITLGIEYHRGTTLYKWARDLAERITARHRSQA